MKISLRDRAITLRRFANRLAQDVAGNTLAMVAISIIPVLAMIGSGVDMSRAYLVKSRLQQACDAGALAGRRAMTGPTLDSASETQARNLFNFNFPSGTMGTTSLIFTPTHTVDANGNAAGQVTATASVTVPTSIMKMFGKQTIDIAVECDAKLEIANTDIMFVLDVTGSMNCSASDTPSTCSNNGNVEKSDARIKALRTAVVGFYDSIASAADSTARLRFGFAPYSSGINVGGLLPSAYLTDSHTYQSRVANYTTPYYVPHDTVLANGNPLLILPIGTQRFRVTGGVYNPSGTPFNISNSNCNRFGNNTAFSVTGAAFNPSPAGSSVYDPDGAAGLTTTAPTAPTGYVRYQFARLTSSYSGSNTCDRTVTATRRTYTTEYTFTNWTYRPEVYNTSAFKTGSSVSLALSNVGRVPTAGSYNAQQLASLSGTTGITSTNSTWTNQCIEERDTVAQADYSTVPDDAFDVDIDLTPNSAATRWRPIWNSILFDRNTGNNSLADETTSTTRSSEATYCPKAAQKLAVMTHADVYNYVNASDFRAIGSTYHDFGMIWGARLVSPTGIFASDNATAPNGKPINRHIVFMTDGVLQPSADLYTAYGLERLDRRVSGAGTVPTNGDLTNRHLSRFSAVCEAARAKNITIWVVAYAQTMTTELQNCADPGKSFYASNDAELQAQFQLIAQRIARLRLSK